MALVLLLAAVGAGAEPPATSAVLDAFAKIAFGDEFAAEPDPRLRKWVRPIRWRHDELAEIGAAERGFLARHMARLARLSGHDIAPAAAAEDANFIVLFVAAERYEATIARHLASDRGHLLPRLAHTACLGILRHRRATLEIEHAVAIVPIDRARARGLIESCIAEETTQLLGLRNDSDEVAGTLFNDRSDARDLTQLDEILVRLLYHPRLRPGMRRDEALAAVREVLPSLAAGAR